MMIEYVTKMIPRRARPSALALWKHMTTGSSECGAPMHFLRTPSMSWLAKGVASLARAQTKRGIRTL